MQYIQPNSCNYYFGRIHRDETESILRKRGCLNGLYLLRQHLHDLEVYVLSLCYDKRIRHYKFEKRKGKFCIGNSTCFVSPIDLVEHLKSHDCGLISRPALECNRFQNTVPVNYLFISTEDFVYNVDKEIKKQCRTTNDVVLAQTSLRYKYEKIALKRIHFVQQWYRKNINREAAEDLFHETGFHTGKFMVRSNRLMRYKLSVCVEQSLCHYAIVYNDRRYSIEGSIGEEFETIAQLIDYYGRQDIGGFLKCRLQMPFNVNLNLNRDYLCDTNEYYNAFLADNEELLFHLRSIKNQVSYSDLAMKIPSTVFMDQIAEGNNSRIFKALCTPKQYNSSKIEVAIKILKIKTDELRKEYKLMSELNHPNIVKIIEPAGSYPDEEIKHSVIIFEYARLGSFNSYLRENPNLKTSFLVKILQQISSAMVYLASKNIVHRDVAARNVLLFSKDVAKLSDFGLSRKIEEDSNYYCSVDEQAWPVKWYPPEVFELRRFNEKSDVWSFGVLIWESFSNGDVPYGFINAYSYEEVKSFFAKIQQGKLKLGKPEKCPDEFYRLINACLNIDYSLRPKFNEIHNKLKTSYEFVKEKNSFYSTDLEMSQL